MLLRVRRFAPDFRLARDCCVLAPFVPAPPSSVFEHGIVVEFTVYCVIPKR